MRCRTRRRPELAAALALALSACGPDGRSGSSDAPSVTPPAPRYADALAGLDDAVARATPGEPRARALLERARLSGSFDDYVEALGVVVASGNRPAPGSCATGVRVELAVHRLAAARHRLQACDGIDAPVAAEHLALQAELALQGGDLHAARALARSVLAQRETPADLARLALVHAGSGAPDEAVALLDRAARLDHAGTPALRAWLRLQRGLVALHRGRWQEALAQYLAADRELAGWWLVEEHIAEVRALLGQRREAIEQYRAVAARTAEPSLMDALALLLREAGDAEAQAWITRAAAAHRARLERLPEAAAGHAAAHFLDFAPGTTDGLALARRDATARGDATARLLLARAELAAGRPREAARQAEALRMLGWETAELLALDHAVRSRLGAGAAAARAAQRAGHLNPRWREQYPLAP